MGFGSDLRKIAQRRNLDLRMISRTVPLRIFNAVVRDTRVDTGRLRGNWQVTGSTPALTAIPRLDKNEGGPLAADEALKVKAFSVTHLTNNLPYAQVYEEKDAMIGRAIADFKRLVREEVKKL